MAKPKPDIASAYEAYVLAEGRRPTSVQAFTETLKLSETDFYASYASFAALERALFLQYFETTLQTLSQDETYQGYSIRERMLALFYTWMEQLKEHRSFIIFLDQQTLLPVCQDYVHAVRTPFQQFVRKELKAGIESGEIADRWLLTRWYRNALWAQGLMVLNYWLRDTSKGFEKTDALIEKTLNFFFDSIQPNALDSGFDLLKFLVRS